MSKFAVTISREAGVYTKDLTVEAKTQEEAEQKAQELANKNSENRKFWNYKDPFSDDYGCYEFNIQIEDCEKI